MTRRKTLIGFMIPAIVVAVSLVWQPWSAEEAQAFDDLAAARVATFVGTDDNGNFQAALEDALGQADFFFSQFGADLRYNYSIVQTTGERGGFVFFNNIFVKIKASL